MYLNLTLKKASFIPVSDHNYLGFGLLDAFNFVTLAEHWKNIGPQINQEGETQISSNSIGTQYVCTLLVNLS